MNTADHSLTLIDLALRRRFTFVEMLPQTEKLCVVQGLDIGKVLSRLNTRLNLLLDSDHQIGHSYLLSVADDDLAGLSFVWNYRIVPLLQEYFYNNSERLHALLGKEFMRPIDVDAATKKALEDVYHEENPRYEFIPLSQDELLEALKKFV